MFFYYSYTHEIEAVSCDEMLIDCTDILSDTGAEPLDLASLLRQSDMSNHGLLFHYKNPTKVLV
jgi:DNA repair protein REV1